MKPALVRQHGDLSPPDLLAEWLAARGIPFDLDRSWVGGPVPDPERHSFVISLGSRFNPRDRDEPLVADELRLVDRAVARDVPVLGLCFGGQVLAAVLGAEVDRAPEPELGWYELETDDPELVPAGPWLEWHFERFTVPAGAREVARTPVAPQAFVVGPHLGVQFHPESTVETVAGWARKDRDRLVAMGIEDAEALLDGPEERRRAAREAAFQLFDSFLARIDEERLDTERAAPQRGEEQP